MPPNEPWHHHTFDDYIVFIRKCCHRGPRELKRYLIPGMHFHFSIFRGSNCLEMKKETEIKIQTLTSDHKSKVRKHPHFFFFNTVT